MEPVVERICCPRKFALLSLTDIVQKNKSGARGMSPIPPSGCVQERLGDSPSLLHGDFSGYDDGCFWLHSFPPDRR